MNFRTIHARINLMLIIIGIIFLGLLSTLFLTIYKQEKLILKESKLQFQNEVNSLITNKTEILKQVAYDYTFWNDFAYHMGKADSVWFENNITTILRSFRVDYVCVYDTTFQMVHEAAAPTIKLHAFITNEVLVRLKEKRFLNFFQNTPEGLVEVSAASVHTEDDPSHQLTRPKGYLFIVRIWDQEFLSRISVQSGAEASLPKASDTEVTTDEYVTNAEIPLYDVNKQEISSIVFHRSSNLINMYRRMSVYMLLTMLLAISATWIIISMTARKWLTKPLELVTKILETEDNSLINKLKQCPGEFKQIGSLFSDFVEQKKELRFAKEKAEESDILKSTFLANISHEIRTPMNGILGFIELLKEPILSGEEHQQYINIIEHSGKRMLNIINDLIIISKVETKQLEVVMSESNINDQIRYIYSFFKPEADQLGLELIFKTGFDDNESHIWTDREKIYALFTNLVNNALKFTFKGYVEFGYKKRGDFLEFYVKDTGVGIQENQQETIFERFRQVSENLARSHEGAGLGLAISKAYVEMLGGRIWVESEFGKGSTFFFTIPLNKHQHDLID